MHGGRVHLPNPILEAGLVLPTTHFALAPPRPPSGWPDATNTGVLGASLTTIVLSGALWRETTDGAGLYTTEVIGGQTYHVYSNYWFQGGSTGTYLYIDFAYIKFQTCKFTATVHISNTSALVQTAANCVASIFNDCTFDGGPFHQRGIFDTYSNMTIRRCDFTKFGNSAAEKNDAGAATSFDCRDSYLHEVKGWDLGDHIDGLQCAGASSVTFAHNTVFVEPYGYTDGDTTPDNVATSCVNLAIDIGNVGNVLIDNNYISGGGYCMYVREQGKVFTGTVVVSNNYFDRNHWTSLGGKAEVYGSGGVLNPTSIPAALSGGGWQNNHWEDGSTLSYTVAIT